MLEGLGNFIRGIFHNDDDEEKRRQQAAQRQAANRYQNFDAGRLTVVNSNSGRQRPLTVQRETPQPKLEVPQNKQIYTPEKNTTFSSQEKNTLEERLNKGQSWEDISRDTGIDLGRVRQYSQATRPHYGISRPEHQEEDDRNIFSKVYDTINPADSGRSFTTARPSAEGARESVGDQLAHLGEDYGPLVRAVSGEDKREQERLGQAVAQNQQAFEAYTRQFREGKISKERYQALLNSLDSQNQETMQSKSEVDKDDLRRTLASAATAGIDLGTAGLGGQAARELAEQGAKQLIKEGAALGTVSGISSGLTQDEVTPESLLESAALGGVFGAGIPAAGAGAGQVRSFLRSLDDRMRMTALVNAAQRGEARTLPLNSLTSYEGAPDRARVEEYKSQIQSTGKVDPLIVMPDESGRLGIEDGKHRYQAMLELGITDAPTMIVTPQSLREVLQGGYAKIPSGRKDPAPELTDQQKQFVNDYANMLEEFDTGVQGGQMVPDGEGGYTRTSDHSKFYRDIFADTGRAPTKRDYFDEARRQLESGRGMQEAVDQYKKLNADHDASLQAGEQDIFKQNPMLPENTTVAHQTEGGVPTTVTTRELSNGDQVVSKKQGEVIPVTSTERAPAEPAAQPVGASDAANGYFEPAAQPEGNPGVVHIKEESNPVDNNIMRLELGAEGLLKTPGRTVEEIVDQLVGFGGVTREQAQEIVNRVAERNNLDISSGRAFVRQGNNTLLDEAGQMRTPEDIATETAANRIPREPGIEHAVVVKESYGQRVYAYIDKNGAQQTFVVNRMPNGRWPKIGRESLPIKSTNSIVKIQQLADNATVNEEAARAKADGITRQFIYTDSDDGLSSILLGQAKAEKGKVKGKAVLFDPREHYIDNGKVVDNAGNILGNYVEVTPEGVNLFAGNQRITLNFNDLDFSKLRNINKPTFTTDDFIGAVSKDPQTQEALREILIYPAQRGQRLMTTEDRALGRTINEWEKVLTNTVPETQRADMLRDSVAVIEPAAAKDAMTKEEALQQFTENYGPKAAEVLQEYEGFLRSVYDNLLERINTERVAVGKDPIQRRQDYITHISELTENSAFKNAWDSLSSALGDIDGNSTRNILPSTIAGTTGSRRPKMKYNPFEQHRTGDNKPMNPFDPLRVYANVALHNIHMTKPITLARSLETALRAMGETTTNMESPLKLKGVKREQYDNLKAASSNDLGAVTTWVQEHANKLAGKSNVLDRALIDNGFGAIVNISRRLQKIAGQSNILGNASSVVAQVAGMPSTLAAVGPGNTARGIIRSFGDKADDAAWRNSDAVYNRYMKGELRKRTAADKAKRIAGVPLEAVERAYVHVTWNANYEKAVRQGMDPADAVRFADRETGAIISWRDMANAPKVYDSAVANVPLQFTREVTQQARHFWRHLDPKQKALWIVYSGILGAGSTWLLGRNYTADPLGALAETARDFSGVDDGSRDESENGILDKTGRAAQRFGSEVVDAIPLASVAANMLPQNTRRKVFGEESDLGRYEGSNAAVSVADNAISAAADLIHGDIGPAASEALGVIPGGGQIRKTAQGAVALAHGYTEDSKGNVRTPIDRNPATAARALLFGPNALPENQDVFARGQTPMGEKQTEVYKRLLSSDPEAAQQYFDSIMGNRESSERPGAGNIFSNAAAAISGFVAGGQAEAANTEQQTEVERDMEAKILEGKYTRDKDGIVKTEAGNIATDFYKDLAKELSESGKQDEKTYNAYVLGYGLKQKGNGNIKNTGNKTSDTLAALAAKTEDKDIVKQAISLYKSDSYAKMPDWVKEQYVKDAGIKGEHLSYAVQASYDNDVKMQYLNDQMQNMDHNQVLQTLYAGRKKSIDGSFFVTTGMLDDMYDADLISNDEKKALKALELDADGKVVDTERSKAARKRSGKVKGIKLPDYSIDLPKLASPGAIAGNAPDVSLGQSAGKVAIRGIKAPEQIKVVETPIKRLAIR